MPITSKTRTLRTTPLPSELESAMGDYLAATARLQTTHETLQNEVARLRDELECKNAELEQRRRLASLGELAAGVAHEVRNPLGAIQLYSGLLRKRLGEMPEALDLISKIDAGIHAIDGVVQDTLALAPRSGRHRPASLRQILVNAEDVARSSLDRANVSVTLTMDDLDTLLQVECASIQRVFVNLLVNGADASDSGSEIHVSTHTSDQHVTIAFADTGSGISDELIDRIFDPFVSTKDHGTGLGLTIAHRLVEAHGGTLSVANRTPHGAVFTIRLPRSSNADLNAAQTSTDYKSQTPAA